MRRKTEGLAKPSRLWQQSFIFCITPTSILDQVQPVKGFIYESVRHSAMAPDTIEVAVVPRQGSQARCSGRGQAYW
jgi:hypothetical protein